MVEGEKTRFWIPEELAYKGKSAPYGMLVFDVELIKISRLEQSGAGRPVQLNGLDATFSGLLRPCRSPVVLGPAPLTGRCQPRRPATVASVIAR